MKKKKPGKLKEELMKKGTSKEMEWYLHFQRSVILKKKNEIRRGNVGEDAKSFIMKLTAEYTLIRAERHINIYKRLSKTTKRFFFGFVWNMQSLEWLDQFKFVSHDLQGNGKIKSFEFLWLLYFKSKIKVKLLKDHSLSVFHMYVFEKEILIYRSWNQFLLWN